MTPLPTVVADNNDNRDVFVAPDNTDQNNNNENDQNDNNNYQNDNNDENDKRSREGEEKEEDEVGTAKKRARGRPPGSKNKPKTPVGAYAEQQNVFLEVESGSDIVSSLAAYARARGLAVLVLHATGIVSGCVIIRHPHNHIPLSHNGTWELITLSGTVLPPDNNTCTDNNNTCTGLTGLMMGLTATVANSKGQVVGGRVEGRLIAEGPVSILVATFRPFAYQKLTTAPPQQQEYYGNPGWNPMSMGLANRVITGSSPGAGQQTTSIWPVHPQNNGAPPN